MAGESVIQCPLPVFYVGQHETRRAIPVTHHVLQQARDCGYDMLTTPISSPHLHAEVWKILHAYFEQLELGVAPDELPTPLLPPFKPAETYLSPNDTIGQLLAFTSTWIDLCSPDPVISNVSRQIFNQEIAYAAFCGVGHIVVEGPRFYRGQEEHAGIAQFARAIQEALSLGPYVQIHVLMPIAADSHADQFGVLGHLGPLARPKYFKATAQEAGRLDPFDAWDGWNIIRTTCKYNNRLSVALTIPKQLPSVPLQSRWLSEPVRLLVIPGSSFRLNNGGYPTLSANTRALIARFMRLKQTPWILLSDVGPIPGLNDPNILVPVSTGLLSVEEVEDATSQYPTPAEAATTSSPSGKHISDATAQLSYIRHLQRHQPPKPTIERWATGYQDYLQTPLQPLADNLESITYETFEKDPIKYKWYRRAIERALQDWFRQGKAASSATGAVVVAVVGAGRGPLVTRALRASENTGVPIELYAVEKNPNAYVMLQRKNEDEWHRRVTVVKSDMRSWRGPVKADGTSGQVDILVSELLGSFADNELSPECLDGVQHVLNPDCGISIPMSYTAHLSPVAAPKLHADVQARSVADPSAPETSYVVMLQAVDYLSTQPGPNYIPNRASTNNELDSAIGMSPNTPRTTLDPRSKRRMTFTPINNIEKDPPVPNIQTCWEFKHPVPARILEQADLRRGGGATGGGGGVSGGDGANEHNTRMWSGRFSCKCRGVCHGLAGWFETVLYQSESTPDQPGRGAECAGLETDSDVLPAANGEGPASGRFGEKSRGGNADDGGKVELSTNPATMEQKSPDMISWFPIFFPLKVPMYIPDDSELQVSMWRQTDDRKVWYEWMVESFVVMDGKRMRLGVSDLHSSKKNGCLM